MTFDRKKYAREWARRQTAKKDAANNQGSRTCQHRYGAGVCGALLESVTDGDGRVSVECPACRRRMAGICADCNRAVEGRVGSAVRCAEHKKARAAEFYRGYRRDNLQKVRASARRYYKSSKARRKARAEYKRAWRKANRDKIRAQKRRSALRGVAAKAAQRHRDKVQLVVTGTEFTRSLRTCLTCPTIVHGRVKKCVMCKAREALIAKDHPSLGRGKGWRSAA